VFIHEHDPYTSISNINDNWEHNLFAVIAIGALSYVISSDRDEDVGEAVHVVATTLPAKGVRVTSNLLRNVQTLCSQNKISASYDANTKLHGAFYDAIKTFRRGEFAIDDPSVADIKAARLQVVLQRQSFARAAAIHHLFALPYRKRTHTSTRLKTKARRYLWLCEHS
jgi:hypothetical protein